MAAAAYLQSYSYQETLKTAPRKINY